MDNYLEYIESKVNDSNSSFPSSTQACKKYYKERKGVVINTSVGVKGEEFEVVITYGILEGYLPHWNKIINKRDRGFNASMKKLYVICSRAKNYLHLISEKGRRTKKMAIKLFQEQSVRVHWDSDLATNCSRLKLQNNIVKV